MKGINMQANLPLKKETKILLHKIILNMIVVNIFIFTLFFICIYKINPSDYILFPLYFYIVPTVLLNIVIIRAALKINHQQKIINTYSEYLAVIEQSITQVRARQHQYNNHLSAINSLAISCPDYDTLKKELSKNIEYMSNASKTDEPIFLLEFNLKLMAGFLFHKYTAALSNGIKLSFNIENYNINTGIPEYKLVEAIGILIDNAVDACMQNSNFVTSGMPFADDFSICNQIFIKINCIDHQFIFIISNPGPIVNTQLSDNIFKRGYTTKDDPDNRHGYGLNNLKDILDRYNGTIELGNDIILNRSYIYFKIVV